MPEIPVETDIPVGDPKPTEPVKEVASKQTLKLLRERAAFDREKQSFAQAKTQLDSELKFKQDVEAAKASGNPIKALKAIGFDDNAVAKMLLSGGKQPDEKEQKVAELESKLTEQQKQFAEFQKAQKDAEAAALTAEQQEIKEEIHNEIKSKPEAYPWINALGQQERVTALIQDHYTKTKEILDDQEAAKLVEAAMGKEMGTVLAEWLKNPKVREVLEAALAGQPVQDNMLEGAMKAAPKADLPQSMQPGTPFRRAVNKQTTTSTTAAKNKSPDQLWRELVAKNNL